MTQNDIKYCFFFQYRKYYKTFSCYLPRIDSLRLNWLADIRLLITDCVRLNWKRGCNEGLGERGVIPNNKKKQ